MSIKDIGLDIRSFMPFHAPKTKQNTQAECPKKTVEFANSSKAYAACGRNLRTNYNNSMFINSLKEVNNADKDGFSDFEKKILETSDVIQSFGRQGIPLEYPRKDFLQNIAGIIENEPKENQEELWSKMKIQPVVDWRGQIVGYNGLISLGNLNEQNPVEKKLYDEGYRFIFENRANSGDKKTDELINGIIEGMPEFVNIIGKQQHRSHDYSVDIHSLSVLSNVLQDEGYRELSDEGKFVMKMTALLHDTGKGEFVPDPKHPIKSLALCMPVVQKYKLEKSVETRVLNSIKDHQWLQSYNMSGKDEDVVNALVEDYNSREDYKMAKIFARADLKATSEHINFAFRYLLNDEEQIPLQEAVDEKFGK